MCYSIFLSTDSTEDFAINTYLYLCFSKDLSPEPSEQDLLPLLAYPNRWFLNRSEFGGCSCHFLHSRDDHQFREPLDWLPQGADDVSATEEAYNVFSEIIRSGYKLDVLDVFSNRETNIEIRDLEISFGSIEAISFRFFENYRFNFSP